MGLSDQVKEEMKAAMRSGDTVRRDTLRLLISALRNAEIDQHGPLDEEGEQKVVGREVKQRRDSITEYRAANRDDLADREEAEMAILAAYLPQQLGPEELRELVSESIQRMGAKGPSDLGRVMKDVMPRLQGRADGSAVNAMARDILLGAAG